MTRRLAEKIKTNLKELVEIFKKALSSPELLMQQRRKMVEGERDESTKHFPSSSNGVRSPRGQEQKALSPRSKDTPMKEKERERERERENEREEEGERREEKEQQKRKREGQRHRTRTGNSVSAGKNGRGSGVGKRTCAGNESGGAGSVSFPSGIGHLCTQTRLLVTELHKPLAESDYHDFAQARAAISSTHSLFMFIPAIFCFSFLYPFSFTVSYYSLCCFRTCTDFAIGYCDQCGERLERIDNWIA